MLTVRRIALVLSILVLCAGSSYSEPPPPAPSKSADKQKPNAAQHEQSARIDNRGTEQSPIHIKVLPPLAEPPRPNKEQDSGYDYTSAEWWLVYITGALVFATIGLMIYTARLWRETQRLAEDTKNASAAQATDMKTSLSIAQQSADAAIKSAEVAEKALTTTAKAIIFNSHIHAVPGLSQKAEMAVIDWTFYIVWKNTGTTPTRHLHMHTNWKPFDMEMPGDFDFPDLGTSPPFALRLLLGQTLQPGAQNA